MLTFTRYLPRAVNETMVRRWPFCVSPALDGALTGMETAVASECRHGGFERAVRREPDVELTYFGSSGRRIDGRALHVPGVGAVHHEDRLPVPRERRASATAWRHPSLPFAELLRRRPRLVVNGLRIARHLELGPVFGREIAPAGIEALTHGGIGAGPHEPDGLQRICAHRPGSGLQDRRCVLGRRGAGIRGTSTSRSQSRCAMEPPRIALNRPLRRCAGPSRTRPSAAVTRPSARGVQRGCVPGCP